MVSVDHAMSDQEDEVDPSAHQQLLAGINNLVRTQDIQKATRTEPSVNKSEFHLVKRFRTEADGDDCAQETSRTVNVGDLLGLLKKTTKNTEVAKDLKRIKKKRKTLQAPLTKPVADRIGRDVLYGKAQKNLDLWEPVVTASEFAPQTVFPLQYGSLKVENKAPQKLSQYRVKSDLMKAMEELDKKYKGEDSSEEEVDKYELTLDELREKRKEAARQKMREAYKIAKGRRMNKIKSKKFHRLMKRDKIRAQMKQFEELQKTDPEAALKQLELIEKQRYQERVSLRHKNTGSWAKNMQIRAQYDMDVRKELAEQLSIGKELMAKRVLHEDSSESGEEEVDVEDDGEDNPWFKKPGEHEQEVNRELTSGYRKYWEQRNKAKEAMKQFNETAEEEDNSEKDQSEESTDEESEHDSGESEEEQQLELFKKEMKKSKAISTSTWEEEDIDESEAAPVKNALKKKRNIIRKEQNVEELFDDAEQLLQQRVTKKIDNILDQTKSKPSNRQLNSRASKQKADKSSGLAFKKKASLADADMELTETADSNSRPEQVNIPVVFADDDENVQKTSSTSELLINPNQFVNIRSKHLLTALPDSTTGGDLSDDDDPELKQRLTIAEAFENDDIVADFEQEKQEERDRTKPQEVDLFLPGWGSWGGPGINEQRARRNRRKMFKPAPVLPRRDDNKEKVIINEDGLSKKMAAHLVNELPFPFVSVKDYEASLRAPLGRTFIPETAHSALVEPRVVTKMGAVIEPMKKEILLQNPSESFKVGGKMFNKAIRKYEEFLEKKDGIE